MVELVDTLDSKTRTSNGKRKFDKGTKNNNFRNLGLSLVFLKDLKIRAATHTQQASVAELVDASDLKS